MKSSTPACSAMVAAVSGLSPVTITVRRPIRRSRSNRSRMPGFKMSSSTTMPAIRFPSQTNSGVAPCEATVSTCSLHWAGTLPPCCNDVSDDRVRGPFANRSRRPAGRCRSFAFGR